MIRGPGFKYPFGKYFRPSRTAVGLMNTARSIFPAGRAGVSGSISTAGKRNARPPAPSIRLASPCASDAGRVTTTPLPCRLT